MRKVPAKVLEPDDLCRLLKHAQTQRYPIRNKTIILLSFKAGLRASEIAGLDWQMVLASNNSVSDQLYISANIAKKGSKRFIPLNSELKAALITLHAKLRKPSSGPVIVSERGNHMRSGAIVNYFSHLYRTLGLEGCSSHSGRRTFITNAAKAIVQTGGSLRDVQELAGHKAITTTELYIQGDRAVQRKLIKLI